MPQNEPGPNRLSLGASIIHVPVRSTPAQNRSRRFSVTYICAGRAPLGSEAGWGWLAELAAAHPTHPRSLRFALGLPYRVYALASVLSLRIFLFPVRGCLFGVAQVPGPCVDPFRCSGVRGRQRRLGFPGPCRTTLYPREDGSESNLEGWGISLGCTFFRRTSTPLPRGRRSGNSPWRDL